MFVNHLEDGVSIYLGTDKGLKGYAVSYSQQSVVEKFVVGKEDELNNAISLAFDGQTMYLAGDNGFIYVLDHEGQVLTKIKTETTGAINCLGFVKKNEVSLLLVLAEDVKAALFKDGELVDHLDLFDSDIMAKLGSESLKMKPKSFAVLESYVFIGFEENTIIRYSLEDNTVSSMVT